MIFLIDTDIFKIDFEYTHSAPGYEDNDRLQREKFGDRGDTNGATVCILTLNNSEIMGIARCHRKDNFCKETGRKIALKRALKNMKFVFNNYPHLAKLKYNEEELKKLRGKIWYHYLNRISV